MKYRITDYKSLLQEKSRLRSHINDTEKNLHSHWNDLVNHYPEKVLQPSLPFNPELNEKKKLNPKSETLNPKSMKMSTAAKQ